SSLPPVTLEKGRIYISPQEEAASARTQLLVNDSLYWVADEALKKAVVKNCFSTQHCAVSAEPSPLLLNPNRPDSIAGETAKDQHYRALRNFESKDKSWVLVE